MYEKVSGAGVPARHPVCTGWKACATGETFQGSYQIKLFQYKAKPA
jgi:hypothetical protein